MNRNAAVTTWREVCGSDTVMASFPPTDSMLEEFARRIEAAEHARIVKRLREEATYSCPCADDANLTNDLADILLAEGAGGSNLPAKRRPWASA